MEHSVFLLLLFCIVADVKSMHIRGCNEITKSMDVLENVEQTFSCDNIERTSRGVTWAKLRSGRFHSTAGYCDGSLTCTSYAPQYATVNRPTYCSSTMTIKNFTRRVYTGGAEIGCYTLSPVTESFCNVNAIYPAEFEPIDKCGVSAVMHNGVRKLNGTCNVAKSFSVNNIVFNCLWTHTTPSGSRSQIPMNQTQGKVQLTLTEDSIPTYVYVKFPCNFLVDLPVEEGRHIFTVTAYPGAVVAPNLYYTVEKN